MSTTIESSWENERLKEEIESLRQQLVDSQKREVTLRNSINDGCLCISQYGDQPPDCLLEALAATADLDGLIVCEKEPCVETLSVVTNTGYVYVRAIDRKVEPNTQLFRAWRPKQ